MKSITIDQLDIKDHVRWAQDQESYDISFIQDSHLVAPHPEVLGISIIYPSKFEELFELQKRNLPWAHFAPPKNFYTFSKRFFSYRLFPDMDWKEKKEEEEDLSEEGALSHNLIQEILHVKKRENQSQSLFEKDKTAILNLLESIEWINQLLKQIHGRKLQYQKG